MEGRQILAALKTIAENPFSYLGDWKKKTGQKILGYFCTHTPEEMVLAAGLLPVRLLSNPGSISLASKHLQSYSCSLVQSSLEAALRGDLNFLDGTVFPHTCDSIQRLSDIWAENLRFPFHWDLVLPVKLHTKSARAYLVQELGRFRLGLQSFIGRSISDDDLHAAIALANENRSLLRKFYLPGANGARYFSAGEFLTLVKTAALLPKEEHNARLKRLLSVVGKEPPLSSDRVRLFLAGSVCDQSQIFELFELCGASIAGDDLCTGWRYFTADVSPEGDPLEALAERFIRKVPCPCKYNPNLDRGEDLLQRAAAAHVHGVVFIFFKFCDPHAFDYPYLKGGLEEQRIPSLLLEIEPGSQAWGSVQTRLRAFVESLGG